MTYYDYMNTILGPLWAQYLWVKPIRWTSKSICRLSTCFATSAARVAAWGIWEVCLEKDPDNHKIPSQSAINKLPKIFNGAKLCLNRNTMSLCQLNHKSPFWITYKSPKLGPLDHGLHAFGDQGLGIRRRQRRHHRWHRAAQAKGQGAHGAAWDSDMLRRFWTWWWWFWRFWTWHILLIVDDDVNVWLLRVWFCFSYQFLWPIIAMFRLMKKGLRKKEPLGTFQQPTCSLRSHGWSLLGDLRNPRHLWQLDKFTKGNGSKWSDSPWKKW